MDSTKSTEKTAKKKLSLSRPGKLELQKTVEGGQVRQNFSHGRSKVVTVEVKKKRTFAPGSSGSMTEVVPDAAEKEEPRIEEVPVAKEIVEEKALTPSTPHSLTDQERATRAQALQEANKAETQKNVQAHEKESLGPKEKAKQKTKLESEQAQIDCLLYTSPSPRDATLSRMPSSA